MKKCSYCAEEIQDEAKICRFCNREQNGSQQAFKDNQKNIGQIGIKKPLLVSFIAWFNIIGGFFFLIVLGIAPDSMHIKDESLLELVSQIAGALIGIAIGAGLIGLKKWAWYGQVGLTVYYVVAMLLGLLLKPMPPSSSAAANTMTALFVVIAALLYVWVISYFFRIKVREIFNISFDWLN